MPTLGSSASSIALCPRCKHDILPHLAQPSWHRETHRAPAAEREDPADPRADAIRRRKARKTHTQVRVAGILAVARFYIETKAYAQAKRQDPMTVECEDCLKLQHERDGARGNTSSPGYPAPVHPPRAPHMDRVALDPSGAETQEMFLGEDAA